jgi:hypothetical protein
MQFVAGVDVGDVDLEDRAFENLQGVEHRDRGEGIGGGVDDRGSASMRADWMRSTNTPSWFDWWKASCAPAKAANSSRRRRLSPLSELESLNLPRRGLG